MSEFSPLIEAAAWWVMVDAALRIFWSGVGVVAVIAIVVVATIALRRFLAFCKP